MRLESEIAGREIQQMGNMPKETKRREPAGSRDKDKLVHEYREIGISSVAAAARYQRVGPKSNGPRHIQARSSAANADASLKSVRTK